MHFLEKYDKILLCRYAHRNALTERIFIMELFLMIILLISALVIIIAVMFQDSNEDGLSGTISGKSETYYGRDKSTHKNRMLYKWTLIFAIVFALAVFLVYAIQPDIVTVKSDPEAWKNYVSSDYSSIL